MNGPTTIEVDVNDFVMRLLTDCLNEQTKAYWLRRAAQFEAARPQPGEYHGRATREQLKQRWDHLTEVATACRNRASMSPIDEIAPEVADALREIA